MRVGGCNRVRRVMGWSGVGTEQAIVGHCKAIGFSLSVHEEPLESF